MLNGPIVFLTREMYAPACLSNLAAFAAASGRDLSIMLQMPKRSEPIIFKKRIEILLESLPEPLKHLTIQGVHASELQPALQELASNGGALLALAPTRRGNPLRAFSQNDYERLLLDTSLPVLALPSDGQIAPPRKLLFPIDLSPRSDAALSDTISYCKQVGAELHILHVYGADRLLPSEQDFAKRQAAASPRDLFDLDQQRIQELGQRGRDQGVETTVATAEGRAHSQILAYVSAQQIDLIVMATHGPRSAEDILLGSTTVRTILKSRVAVIGVSA
jgi:nucleotide-binding universal stress UspA family protein